MTATISLLFPAILLAAALYDISSFTIPNRLVAILVCAWPIAAAATDMTLMAALWAVAAAGLILALCFFLFAFGKLGAGDAKLMAASALYVGADLAIPFILKTAMTGAIVALVLLFFRRFPLPAVAYGQSWLADLHGRSRDMPYGVAIAAGGIACWPLSPFYLF